ncbi:MAG: hypothetical protein HYX69_08810 [Planctomycetia bacterium]|nr:hypothetical protein [Planctomycetia bacterium]
MLTSSTPELFAMQHSHLKPNRLDVFGDSMLNKLPARSRRQRKRQASKKRRAMFHSRGNETMDD